MVFRRDPSCAHHYFFIYINDICNVSRTLNYTLFADDTSVFLSYREINTLEQNLNSELPKLTLWFRSNVLSLNVLKTNYIYSRGRKCNDNLALNIKGKDQYWQRPNFKK